MPDIEESEPEIKQAPPAETPKSAAVPVNAYELDGDLDFEEPEAKAAAAEPKEDDDDTQEIVKEEPKPAPIEAKKPASLIRLARSLGVTEARIASLSADRLDELCDTLMETRDAEIAANAAKKKADPEPVEEDDDLSFGDLEEEIDEQLKAPLKGKFKKQSEKIKALTEKLDRIEKFEQERAARQHVEAIERGFALVNHPLLGGNKPVASLAPGSAELKRRNTVLQSLISDPMAEGTLEERIHARAKELFGITDSEVTADPEPKAKPKAKAGRITEEQWDNAGVAVPGGRRIPEEAGTGRSAAISAIERKMRENKSLENSMEISSDTSGDDDLPL